MVLISLFLVTTFLLTKPSVLLAVLVILFMWVFELRSLLMVTPRYFDASTDSSSRLCMKYLDLTRLFERVIWITWHLPGLSSISQVLSQCWRDSKSDWSTWLSCMLVTVRYTAVSSANNLTWDWMFSGRSLMYNRKKSGPSTEPWGTPEVTLTSSDDSPSSTTVWVQPIRNDWIQFKVFPLHQNKKVYIRVLDDLLCWRLC